MIIVRLIYVLIGAFLVMKVIQNDEVVVENRESCNFLFHYLLFVMKSFGWPFSKKDDIFWNKFDFLIILSLITVFFVWRAIVKSWHLFLYIICFLLWVVIYFTFKYVKKKISNKPASLWIYAQKYPVIVQYAPPKWINPAEAWLLYNCRVEPTDLTSLIYQWKFEELIDIKTFKWESSQKDYIKLIKLENIPLNRPLFETGIFDSIFSVSNIKIIEWSFQLRYALMLEDLEYHWIQKWWLEVKWNRDINWGWNSILNKGKHVFWLDDTWNQIWFEVFLIWIFLVNSIFSVMLEWFWVSGNSLSFTELIWSIVMIFCVCLWSVLFYWVKDWWGNLKFTEKWAELASKVIGYSQFIKSCDENKIKMFLEEDPLFIDRTLPYATAFGIETEFLKKISPLKEDWNAKYVRWKKSSPLAWIIRFLIKGGDSSLF